MGILWVPLGVVQRRGMREIGLKGQNERVWCQMSNRLHKASMIANRKRQTRGQGKINLLQVFGKKRAFGYPLAWILLVRSN